MNHPFHASEFGEAGVPRAELIRDAMRERFARVVDDYGPRERSIASLAKATRLLIQKSTSTTTTNIAAIDEATDLLKKAVDLLAAGPHDRPYFGSAEGSLGGGASAGFFDYSPFVGLLSPLSPPLEIDLIDDRVVARTVYQRQYEGPPSCLHGGLIAAGFDEVLGFAQSLSGQPGMTGKLEVRYRSPTPLFEEVTYEGWLVKVDGRKIFTEGTLKAGDRLCAEASGLFISFKTGFGAASMVDASRRADSSEEVEPS